MEHPAADDIFNGIIMFKTQVESVRIAKPGATILEPAIETVGIDLEVN